MNTQTRKYSKNAITIVIYAVIFVFIVLYLRKIDLSKISAIEINWTYGLAAVPFSILSRIFLPYIWVRLIRTYKNVDTHNEYWHLNYIYAKSWLGRYVPGNVAWVGGKIYFALERGISKTILGITSVVEAALQLLTAMILGVVFLFISGAYSNFPTWYNIIFSGAVMVGLVTISPPVFNRLIKFGYRVLKKQNLDEKYYVSIATLVKISSLYFMVHALSALPIYFLVKAIGIDLSFIELIYVAGAFIFAGAVGTLAIVSPSGLGIREGVILLFLVNVIPPELSLVLVVVLRVWSIFLDFVYFCLSYLIIKLWIRL